MDWVHCNNCFQLPDPEKRFFLTSCGHIFCSHCEEKCARGQCKLCGNHCTSIILSSSMKPDVQMYFSDPIEHIRKATKEAHQVAEFQKNHRARLLTHQKKELKKYKSVKENVGKLLKKFKDTESDMRRISQENNVLKTYVSMQRNSHASSASSPQSERAYSKSPPFHSSSRLNTVLSKYVDNFDDSKSHHSHASQRMCVISPPMNGKMGVVPSTPSPSTALQNLNLSTVGSDGYRRKKEAQYMTPSSTSSSYSNYVTPQSDAMTPLDQLSPSPQLIMCGKVPHYKKDVRKLIVHPYSPND